MALTLKNTCIDHNFSGLLYPMNGIRVNAYSFSLNARYEKFHFFKNVMGWAEGNNGSALPFVVLLRCLFEEHETYEEAKQFLSSTPGLSPAYYIVGGKNGNDGVIIATKALTGSINER